METEYKLETNIFAVFAVTNGTPAITIMTVSLMGNYSKSGTHRST